jgi:hypothetical protein
MFYIFLYLTYPLYFVYIILSSEHKLYGLQIPHCVFSSSLITVAH